MPKPSEDKIAVEEMNKYLKEVISKCPEKQKHKVITRRQLRKRCSGGYRLGSRIINVMLYLRLAEPFAEGGENPYYQLDLKKIRKYLESQSGKE